MFTLPQLSYQYQDLEPNIDAKTMEIHHTRHHQAYIDKLNAALQNFDDVLAKPVETLLREIDSLPAEVQTAVRNHGGGHANHTLFWQILGPQPQTAPVGVLAEAIDQKFNSFENFKTMFTATTVGQFGSGWGWLVLNRAGELEIMTTANQDSPLMMGKTPILGIDVWEHAYYLQYQNRRPDYLDKIWDCINWNAVARFFDAARA